jgi:hypothetical protein
MSAQVLHPDLRIYTMTQIARISSDIVLKELYTHLEINDVIKYIEYADLPGKGVRLKPKKIVVPSKGLGQKPTKRKRYFYNQVTIHLFNQKIVNVKVFNNGGIQMTGLKDVHMGDYTVEMLLKEIRGIPSDRLLSILPGNQSPSIMPDMTRIATMNSYFDIGFRINREVLHRSIIKDNYYSSFETAIYPGVNIKYYYNIAKQQTGICNCSLPCDGKGHNGACKKITVAVFNSGKIIIMGAQSLEHIRTAHQFITSFINQYKEFIQIQGVA